MFDIMARRKIYYRRIFWAIRRFFSLFFHHWLIILLGSMLSTVCSRLESLQGIGVEFWAYDRLAAGWGCERVAAMHKGDCEELLRAGDIRPTVLPYVCACRD